jgi:hypothetical protein
MNVHLEALKLLEQAKWDAAHRLIQDESDKLACLIHGLLHRIEGDSSNAAYWYRRAGENLPERTTEDEFARLYGLAGEDG